MHLILTVRHFDDQSQNGSIFLKSEKCIFVFYLCDSCLFPLEQPYTVKIVATSMSFLLPKSAYANYWKTYPNYTEVQFPGKVRFLCLRKHAIPGRFLVKLLNSRILIVVLNAIHSPI
jgi:hypothetical protein